MTKKPVWMRPDGDCIPIYRELKNRKWGVQLEPRHQHDSGLGPNQRIILSIIHEEDYPVSIRDVINLIKIRCLFHVRSYGSIKTSFDLLEKRGLISCCGSDDGLRKVYT